MNVYVRESAFGRYGYMYDLLFLKRERKNVRLDGFSLSSEISFALRARL